MSRITNNIMVRDFNRNYNNSQKKLNSYMNQLSTGKRMQQVSDDALSATKSLNLKSTITVNQRHQENAAEGISWLETTDLALDDVVNTLRQARDLAVQGATDSATPDDKAKIRSEIAQLREHLVDIGNTSYADRYIFNGTKTKTEPYTEADSDNPADYLADGPVSTEELLREVGLGVEVAINTDGNDVGDGGFEAMFADLKILEEDLGTNTAGVDQAIGKIDEHIEETLMARSRVGARQNRLELTESRLEAQEINYNKILSDTEDVDMAETITDLKMEENVHRASLAVGARVIQPSLVDFLR